MAGIFRRIYRERRRLMLVVTLATIAGYLFYSHLPYYIHGVPIAVMTGALYGVLIGASSLVVSLVFPSFRFAMEAFAVSRLIYAAIVASFPGFAGMTVTSPFLNATIVVVGGVLVSTLFYSDWVGRVMARRSAVCQVRLAEPAPQDMRTIRLSDEALRKLCYTSGRTGAGGRLHGLFGPMGATAETVEQTSDDKGGLLRFRHSDIPFHTLIAAWLDDAHGRVFDAAAREPLAERTDRSPETAAVAA